MALVAAYVVFAVLVLFALAQYLLLRVFLHLLRSAGTVTATDEATLPKAAVIVCLRGGDPFLSDCLQAALNQDYPDYDVHIVVDSRSDPAWKTVEEVIDRTGAGNVHVTVLEQPRETCSLKCSSLVQVIASLDDSYRVVALIDADTLAHPTWLRELAAPLADAQVGATTGNRWYMPGRLSVASLVRYLWNAAAVVQMGCFDIPWGGTLAVKRDVFENSDLLDKWSHAFCEDTMLYGVLRELGLRVQFVPSLVMINREDCSLAGFIEWLRRQLLAARLYHPFWWFTVMHALGTSLVWVAALGVALWGLLAGDLAATAWALAAAAAYIGIMIVYLPMLETAVRRVVRLRGEPTRWMSWPAVLAIPAAGVLLQLIYPAVLVSTMRLRRVRWRGIPYEVRGSWDVRMCGYQPYASEPTPERKLSL